MSGATAQLVNTDPPYNVKVEPRSNNAIAAGLSTGLLANQSRDYAADPTKAKPTTAKMRAKDRPLATDDNDIPLIERMEQKDRTAFQSTPNYSAKSAAQIINDRERIHVYDRIPQYSRNFGNEYKTINNPKLPAVQDADGNIPQQQRSLFSSAGVLFILDRDLGLNAYNRYGELVQ